MNQENGNLPRARVVEPRLTPSEFKVAKKKAMARHLEEVSSREYAWNPTDQEYQAFRQRDAELARHNVRIAEMADTLHHPLTYGRARAANRLEARHAR